MQTTTELAKKSGFTPRHLRRIAESLGLKARKYGRTFAWTTPQARSILSELRRRKAVR